MKTFLTFAIFVSFCASSAFAQKGTIFDPNPVAGAQVEFRPYYDLYRMKMAEGSPYFHEGLSVPVYAGYPNRPYDIFGTIIVWLTDPNSKSPERFDAMRRAASAAKVHGADALMLLPTRQFERGLNTGNDHRVVHLAAAALKWKPDR